MAEVDEPLTITPWVEEDGRPTAYFYQLMLGLWRKTGSSGTLLSATTEETQDIAGALVATGGTKTGITITYQDATNDMDFEVNGVLDDLNTLGVATADGEFIVGTGSGVFAYETGATLRTSIGVGTGDSPQFTGIELGNATDTTLTRASAGEVAVEGTQLAKLDGNLQDLDTLGAAASDGQFIVATAAGAFAYESGATARTSMGITIGTDAQAWDAQLDDIAALAVTNSNFIVGDGTNWVAESGATARASLGLIIGTDVQAEDVVLTDLAALSAVANNEVIVGTGAGTYAHESGNTLRTSLGLAIGTDVQAEDLVLTDIAVLSAVADNEVIVGTGTGVYAHESGNTLRTSLGLAIGTDVQAEDAVLTDIAALTAVANNEVIVGTGVGTYAHESGNTLRTSLGLAIGTDVQAEDVVLTDIAALSAVADNEFIVGTGAGTYAHESGATVRTSMGVDAAGTDNSTNITLAGTPNYLTIAAQEITLTKLDISDDTNATGGTGIDISGNDFTLDLNELTTETTIASGDLIAMVDITDNASGKITFSNFESDLNHDSLLGFVANEHIDWTSTTSNFSTSGTVATGALTVTGSIVVSSTVDGRDIATDGTKLDGIESNATADQTTEEIQDIAGPLAATGGTKTGITVTYQDATGDIDFVVDVTPSSTTTFTNKTFDANATGNSLTNVDVADLADGVDGELITWSSLAAPETVAVGTSGHILTSNGVGAAPTFQANAGGGANDTLSNLGTVACNTSLISDTDSTDDLGTTTARWANLYVDSIGDTGQILNIAGTHTATVQPAFLAYNSVDDTNATGNGTTVTVDFDTEVFDQGADFATDTFTAPITGRYLLTTTVSFLSVTSAADSAVLLLKTSNRNYRDRWDNTNDLPSLGALGLSVVADMDAADTAIVTLKISGESSDSVIIDGSSSPVTFFSGCLLA